MSVKYCPYCGSKEIVRFVAEWWATSKEDTDNSTEIDEHQCKECYKSFWG